MTPRINRRCLQCQCYLSYVKEINTKGYCKYCDGVPGTEKEIDLEEARKYKREFKKAPEIKGMFEIEPHGKPVRMDTGRR